MAENPGKASVRALVDNVHSGKYVIPHFQRGYEWQPSMVSDLFVSILQDYYAGLILFWELGKDRVGKEVWDPVWGAQNSKNPSLAILDGQQRLASLYYAIYNPEKKFPNRKTYYRWFLDLDRCLNEDYEEAIYYRYSFHHHPTEELKARKDEWIEKGVVPLAILSDPQYLISQEFGEWLQSYVRSRQERDIIPREVGALGVSNLVHGIAGYEFITTTLGKERDMHDICNIFARINQKGMRLSTFDLMNAFLYPHGISLRKRWEALDNRKLKQVDRNLNEYLLKLVSLHVQSYCSSKYIYNLIPGEKTKKKTPSGQMEEVELVRDKGDFVELWESACHYAEKARWTIMNVGVHNFGAIRSKFIPNTTIVPVLGAVLWESEEYDDFPKLGKALSKWYWSAVLSGDYSGSSDTVMAKDFRDWQRWFDTQTEIDRVARVDEEFIQNELGFRKTTRGSQYNAVLCMLALNGAKDFYTGVPLAMGDYAGEKINDHHIFPTGITGLDSDKSTEFEECRDSILNRTLLLDETNKHKISNKRPSVYLNDIMETGVVANREELEGLMAAHLISSAALDCLFDDDFDSFILEREKAIKEHIWRELGDRTATA